METLPDIVLKQILANFPRRILEEVLVNVCFHWRDICNVILSENVVINEHAAWGVQKFIFSYYTADKIPTSMEICLLYNMRKLNFSVDTLGVVEYVNNETIWHWFTHSSNIS